MSSLRQTLLFLAWIAALATSASAVQRLVIIKADGVPADVLDAVVQERDPGSGKSILPWIDHVFYQHGTRVANFYTRGISLSAPSWSTLDTGQHLVIRGNVEFDRFTFQVYDYLNFFPFYLNYALSRQVDMPGAEVLDESGTPLFIDQFPYTGRYQSFQLYQRGVRWTTLQHGLQTRFSGRSMRDLLDEWQVGIELSAGLSVETERELIQKLQDPQVKYLDFFTGEFDHVAHAVRDRPNQRRALQQLDALVGQLWMAIQNAPLAAETALVLVSDHGMNSDPKVYSQGYNLVDWLRSRAGGAHHVVTNRHPLSDYKVKGLYPFVSRVVTPSDNHLYLPDQPEQYPTVLLDLDGNERASVHFRNSDINRLHILLRQLARHDLPGHLRSPAVRAIHRIIEAHRAEWETTIHSLQEELGAVRRGIDCLSREASAELSSTRKRKWSLAERAQGVDKDMRRQVARLDDWQQAERAYTAYIHSLEALLAFRCERCEPNLETIARLIPSRAMGDRNTLAQLRHYVVGPTSAGLTLNEGSELDVERSFQFRDYLAAFRQLTVRNNVQAGVSAAPVDFVAVRVPRESLHDLPEAQQPTGDAVWLYQTESEQVLLLRRATGQNSEEELLYLPVAGLSQDEEGQVHWQTRTLGPGLPLKLWEDPEFNAGPPVDRATWLSRWHRERDWLTAVHRTAYSNAVIGLLEHFGPVKVGQVPVPAGMSNADAVLLARWQTRRRALVEPDLLILASDHWNFNVRGFNPGGNHGSFFRSSTHAVLLLAGGGIKQQVITDPWDTLSFVPTLRRLLGQSVSTFPAPPIPISTSHP